MSHSPWGHIQQVTPIKRGFAWVQTAGHGGIRVSKKNAIQLPEVALSESIFYAEYYWFEEDCAWAIPFLYFKLYTENEKKDTMVELAEQSVKSWFPDVWKEYSGEYPPLSESYVLRQRKFNEDNANNLVVVSAKSNGDKVEVYAIEGGREGKYKHDKSKLRRFVLEAGEYDNRTEFGFIIDPAKHTEVETFATW